MASDLQIYFKHVPTSQTVQFTAFLESFNDSYSAEWSSEKVFGRMDPIAQYKGTSRVITFGFTVPAASQDEAILNHRKISKLIQFMYPTYEANRNIKNFVITAPPLMMVKFNNFIKNHSSTATDAQGGLLGYIPEMKYDPDLNSNIFSGVDKMSSEGEGGSQDVLAFQSFKVAITLNVLHSQRLGWGMTTSADGSSTISATSNTFPMGYNILKGT